MANLSPLSLSNSLFSAGLNEPNPYPHVANISGGYNTPFLSIVHILNNWSSKRIDDIQYTFATVDNLAIASKIASNAQVGANLQVNFIDASYDNFRVGDIVMDSERIKGKVIAHQAGQITIEPVNTALVAANHFVANATAKQVSDASVKRASHGKESLYVTPTKDYNYPTLQRDSAFIARSDMNSTYTRYKGEYWWYAQEEEMLQRLARNIEQGWVYNDRFTGTGAQGQYYTNGGLVWSIQNRNGTYVKSPNIVDEGIWQDLIHQISVKRAMGSQNLTLLAGRAALGSIQRFINETGKFAGMQNTFGGSTVKGLNYMMYAYQGVTINFFHFPLLDNPVWNPEPCTLPGATGTRGSNSFFLIDTTPIPVEGGGTVPAIEVFHFQKEMYYGHIKGIAAAGADVSDYMNPADSVISSDVDGITAHAQVENGINIVDAKGMAFFEPTA
jgi:hypothetical protein